MFEANGTRVVWTEFFGNAKTTPFVSRSTGDSEKIGNILLIVVDEGICFGMCDCPGATGVQSRNCSLCSSSAFRSSVSQPILVRLNLVHLPPLPLAALAMDAPSSEKTKATLSRGLLAMLAGAFCFSLMALIVKLLNEFGTYELVFWRSVFMFAGSMSILGAKRINPLGPPGSRVLLSMRAAGGFGLTSGYYYAVHHLPLGDAVAITYTNPVITAVAAALLLGEAWGTLDALGSVLCTLGVILISKPTFLMSAFGFPAEPIHLNGLIGAVIAAVMSSAVYLLVRVLKGVHPVVFVNYFAAAGIVFGPICSYLSGETWTWHTKRDYRDWPLLVLLAVFSVAGQGLTNLGLTLETAAKATAMNYSQVVFAFLFETLLLHEPTDLLDVVGSLLIAMWGLIALVKDRRTSAESKVEEVEGRQPQSNGEDRQSEAVEEADIEASH